MLAQALRLVVFVTVASFFGAPAADAQELSAVMTLDATRIAGWPDAAAWNAAPIRSEFVQREPAEAKAPSQRTEVRVLYDATTLHVQVRALDSEPDKILTYLTRRDVESPCDWIRVLIDSYHDRRTAFEFAANPSGVKQDAYWYNDSSRDDSWDAVWDVIVTRDQQGWSAEFRIPFSQLRFTPAPKTTFGFAVARTVGRLKETSTWPLLARSATGYVSSFGELDGIAMSGSPPRLELLPYTVGNVTTKPDDGNPLVQSNGSLSLGLDAKYAVTSGLTLTATINPDFGQVEADPAVVNLSAFETFFPERRPFFVEGSGAFAFGLDCQDCSGLFYSRRIGRSPQGEASLPSGDGIYTDPASQTTIVGAAKLTGRVGKFSIGALHAVTQQERAAVLDQGRRSTPPIEPLTNYSIVSVRRDFANLSSMSWMATSTARSIPAPLEFIADRADTGGINVDWRLDPRYSITGNLAGSRIAGSPQAIADLQENSRHYFQRPDATALRFDPLRRSLTGAAGIIGINKIGGEHTRFNSNVQFKSPGFDINDLGFFQRGDERATNNFFQFRHERPSAHLREWNVSVNQYSRWNFDGDLLGSGVNLNGFFLTASNWGIGTFLNLNHRIIDDRLSRGGPAGLAEGVTAFSWFVDTDERLPVHVNLSGNLGTNRSGSHFRNVETRLTLRPRPPLNLVIAARLNHDINDAQWIENITGSRDRYVFGHLNQTTASATWRVGYTMSPTLSLQVYGEPFVSGGDYSGFKELIDGRNAVYERRFAPFEYASNPDFNVQSFRTTNVLRWEYRPGSTLFVVWQQARDGAGELPRVRFGHDVRELFQVPATNLLLVKFSYWLNF
jgi:hypothetical protein